MRKLFAIATLITGTLFVVSCSEDETNPSFDAVSVSTSSEGSLDNGQQGVTATFAVSVDADLTATYSAVASNATITSEANGAVSGGTIEVTFNAGTTPGAATITLTVTDSQNSSDDAVAVYTVNEVGDNAISISDIPAAATLVFGSELAEVPYQVDALDGIATFELTVNGETTIDFADALGDDLSTNPTSIGGAFSIEFETLLELGVTVGSNALQFTATDVDGDEAAFTHILTVEARPVVSVRGEITENTTWTADNIYQLDTRVTVVDGVTLTIAAGTVIKGNEGQGAAATALLIARGGKLNAQGTAELPIIFTSVIDPIDPADIAAGNYASTTSATQSGQWGGIIVLGRAPITGKVENADGSETEDLAELQIEGIPSTDTNGLYGGNAPADNSGTISYISIRHGGTNIGAGNEINGLTLGGVGSGTSISNVEVVANADDGIEFFGGDVDIDGALVWNSFDDSMDSDQDWNGTVENFVIVAPNTGSAFELDGPEGSRTRGENHIFNNGVVYVGSEADHIVDWDGDTNATLTNIYFFGVTSGNIETFGGNGAGTSTGWETDLAAAGAFFDGVPAASISYGVAVASKTKGPSAADFAWTWAGNSGALSGLGL